MLELWGGNIWGPQAVSFVERFSILCSYLRESTIGGSTVCMYRCIYIHAVQGMKSLWSL